jgi:flagellar basal body rod protein FlgG
LNDITSDKKGNIYVSDSRTAKIWKIENGVAKLHVENVKGVNGLKSIGENLFVGAGKSFQRVDPERKLAVVAETPQGIDGIEPVGNGTLS